MFYWCILTEQCITTRLADNDYTVNECGQRIVWGLETFVYGLGTKTNEIK